MNRLFACLAIALCAALPLRAENLPDTAAPTANDTLLYADSIALDSLAGDSLSLRPDIFADMPYVQVRQDSLVGALLHNRIYGESELQEIDGYRVQIYSSNRQQTAKAEALQLEKDLADRVSVSVYVLYMPPFWKVRLGDFRTYEEATQCKAQMTAQFPDKQGDIYIVRDKIKVVQ